MAELPKLSDQPVVSIDTAVSEITDYVAQQVKDIERTVTVEAETIEDIQNSLATLRGRIETLEEDLTETVARYEKSQERLRSYKEWQREAEDGPIQEAPGGGQVFVSQYGPYGAVSINAEQQATLFDDPKTELVKQGDTVCHFYDEWPNSNQ